jgi:hypothetical protein
LDNDNRIIEG